MKFPLYDRLEAWAQILSKREDLELKTPLTIQPPGDIPADYPADVRALAERSGYLYFSYRAKTGDAAGYLCLALNGERAYAFMELDGVEVAEDQLYVLDGDLEGTGNATWLVARPGVPALIVWSVEEMIQFDSMEQYLTLGAKRGFNYGSWQRDAHAGLASISKSRDSAPSDIVAGLVGRGVAADMAADLVEWLGGDAALLLPA
jgi:hypothetical protein